MVVANSVCLKKGSITVSKNYINTAYSFVPKHLLNHLIVFSHRVPVHLGPLGDGAVIRLVGVNFHIIPDLPLLLGEFLR